MNRLELVDRVAARNTASKAEVDRIIVKKSFRPCAAVNP